MRRVALFLALLSSLSGCSVSSLDQAGSSAAQNTCESDDLRGICRAAAGSFDALLVQITAPAESGEYSLLSFLETVDDIPVTGGALNLDVPAPAELEAEVVPTPGADQGNCATAYGGPAESPTVPVNVRFRPSEKVFGLSTTEIQAETGEVGAVGESYKFKVRMPPGKYDVYVEPVEGSVNAGSCSVVPQVFRNFEVTAGTAPAGTPATPLYLSPPNSLIVKVDWPTEPNAGKSLEGWKVDVLDPVTGWLLSGSATLSKDPELSEPGMDRYVATVEYSRLPDETLAGKELVRLSPPDPAIVAPTFVLERKAIEVLKPGEASINQITTLPDAVQVQGDLFDSDAIDAIAVTEELTLRFVSKKLLLDGGGSSNPNEGTPVYYYTEAPSIGGAYDVALLPGDYDVYAIPAGSQSNVAVTKTSLTVATASLQAGKSLIIDPTTQLQGLAVGPDGTQPISGAKVRAIASPEAPNPIWIALGLTPPKPLSVEDIVGADGGFAIDVHPGALDVSIRPADSTGFAWLVRPHVAVEHGIHDLDTMQLPLPVLYEGAVKVDEDTTLPNALIQAYVFLNEQGYTNTREGAQAVVQVAETRADSAGNFTLLLPAHLN
jgi:hypothetical protein